MTTSDLPTQGDSDTSSSGAGASSDSAVERQRLQEEVARLQKEVQHFKEMAARAQADLQNARVRMEREAGDMRKFAAEALILRFLPLVDHMRRAKDHLPDDLKNHDWVKGILPVEQDFLRIFSDIG